MLKLKLFLFLGKFSKYFKEMAENHIRQNIQSEISIYLKNYDNHNLFKVSNGIHTQSLTSHKIQVDITYNNIPFSFCLEYIKGGTINKTIKIPEEVGEELIIITNYYIYFKEMKSEQLLEYFKHLK